MTSPLEFHFWRGHPMHEIWVLPTIGFDRKRREHFPWWEIILLVGRSSFGMRVYLRTTELKSPQ